MIRSKSTGRSGLTSDRVVGSAGGDMPVAGLARNKPDFIKQFRETLYRDRVEAYRHKGYPIDENKIKYGVNRELANIKAVFNYCIKAGVIAETYRPKIEMYKLDKQKIPHLLNRADLLRLENELKGEQRLVFQILKYTLARRIEICRDRISDTRGLKWKDINWVKRNVKLYAKKKERIVHLHSTLMRILKQKQNELGLNYNPEAHIISLTCNTVTRRFREAMRRLDIHERGNAVHIIRRSCATILLEETGDIKLVKELLGHSDIRTTEVYAYVLDESERKAIELL